jgi:hypothetical protein
MSELAYDVSYTTDEPIEHVRSWLTDHCDGAWKLEKRKASDKGKAWQNLKVCFEIESDIGELCRLASLGRAHAA